MGKKPKWIMIWDILYPICIYFAVTTIALVLLETILPGVADSRLFFQLLTSLAALPFLVSFYRQDEILRGTWKNKWEKSRFCSSIPTAAVIFLCGGCFAIAFNNVLGMLHIAEYSASYRQVEETFYTGRLFLEIIALCFVIPVTEELLYRGIVYKRAGDYFGTKYAAAASAVIFGLIHMNLVQFVYAAIFGLFLAYVTEEGGLFCASAAHMAANLTSVLRAETEIFAFMDTGVSASLCITVILFLVFAAGIWYFRRQNEKRQGRLL